MGRTTGSKNGERKQEKTHVGAKVPAEVVAWVDREAERWNRTRSAQVAFFLEYLMENYG